MIKTPIFIVLISLLLTIVSAIPSNSQISDEYHSIKVTISTNGIEHNEIITTNKDLWTAPETLYNHEYASNKDITYNGEYWVIKYDLDDFRLYQEGSEFTYLNYDSIDDLWTYHDNLGGKVDVYELIMPSESQIVSTSPDYESHVSNRIIWENISYQSITFRNSDLSGLLKKDDVNDQSNQIWPLFFNDNKNSGRIKYDLSLNPGKTEWKYKKDKLKDFTVIDNEGNVYALGYKFLLKLSWEGEKIWEYELVSEYTSYGHPAIGPEGNIYLPVYKSQSEINDYLLSLDSSGDEIWRIEFKDMNGVTIDNIGNLYTYNFNNLMKINSQGVIMWEKGIYHYASLPVFDSRNNIYICDNYEDNFLVSLNQDGSERWINPGPYWGFPVIGNDDIIYVKRFSDDSICAVNQYGETQWEKKIGENIHSFSVSNNNEICYVTNGRECNIGYLNSNQNLIWKIELEEVYTTNANTYPIIGIDETVLIAFNSHLFCIDPEGNIRWEKSFSGRIYPRVGFDGKIICSDNDYIYCLGNDHEKDKNVYSFLIFSISFGIIILISFFILIVLFIFKNQTGKQNGNKKKQEEPDQRNISGNIVENSHPKGDNADKLLELKEMLDMDLITEDEYEKKRETILSKY